MCIEDIKKLLDDFGKIANPEAKEPTFLEISGYPHYENVISNILAFFLRPDEAHGLGFLFIHALLSTNDSELEDLSNVVVERETITDRGNRIDIVIDSDSQIIAIENKIFGCPNNPFSDYKDYIQNRGKNTCRTYYLSLLPPPPEIQLFDFVPITYKSFVSQIRNNLGQYALNANTKYLTFALEFLKSLENLEKGTRMSDAVFQLLTERQLEVTALLKEVSNLKGEPRYKVKQLGEMIDFKTAKFPVKQWFYRESLELFDCLVHDIEISESLPIAIDTYVSPSGWKIEIFVRDSGNMEELAMYLDKLKISFERQERFIYATRFGYREPLEIIADHVQGIVRKIAQTPT